MEEQTKLEEITPEEVSKRRKAGEDFILLDVRETEEYELANLGEGIEKLPLSVLGEKELDAIPSSLQDKEAEIIAFCHHGGRSSQVVAWLMEQGWKNVKNMTGGIHAWAETVDPSIGTY